MRFKKKILYLSILATFVLIGSGTAVGFGGSGKGRVATRFKMGVDAIGVYRGGGKQADVDFSCDAPCEWKNLQCVCDETPRGTIDGWTGNENSNCSEETKPGSCSVCLTVKNNVGETGRNEFWSDSNALCAAGNICAQGNCQTLSGDGCVKNSDCKNQQTSNGEACGADGCYCDYGNSYTDTSYPTGTGNCELKNKQMYEFLYEGEKRVAIPTESDVWSSKNFCEAWNMRLMTWNELNCPVSGTRVTLIYSEGSHFQKAFNAIYGEAGSGFFQLAGYTVEYALVRAGTSIVDAYTNTPFIICR